MTSSILYLTYVSLVTQICSIYGQVISKSSLTFAIDDTFSMSDEIDQVKRSVNSIFDTVTMSKDSQIENFILVTFNDPDAHLVTITKDRNEFKRALATINVHGGDDCPEYSMSGIRIALENSLPHSTIYVFTDASAKDHALYEEIKSISLKKQIQVTYLLTGECGSRSSRDYQVYYELAKATSGEVFNMMKRDVIDILEYVKENIKGRGDILGSKTFPPGYGNQFNYTVDSKTDDVIIAVTGRKPKVEVTDSEGKKVETKKIVHKEEIMIVKVAESKSGVHTANVGSMSETSAKVTGKTTVNFQHGFSSFEPTSLKDTATRPAPDGNVYLSIQLYGEGVKLETAQILDMSDNVIEEFPLRLINESTNFYLTKVFDPPRSMFKIAVLGYDEENKSRIKRISATPIERQNPKYEMTINVAPTISIEEGPKIISDYNSPLQLKCKVHGYPKPDIIWQERDTGIILESTILTIEVPYDYMSILNIEKANKNITYECKASNTIGVNINNIEVEIKKYFNIVETPKDTMNINYDEEDTIVCSVHANPPATITWYKDGKLLSEDSDVRISSDKTTVTIKRMTLESQGKFMCEVRNDVQRKVFHSNVIVSGLVEPKIEKAVEEIYVLQGSETQITCWITQGKPKPTIQWYFQKEGEENFQELIESSNVLLLKNVTSEYAGTYECSASNVVGSDRHAVDLIVEYPPVFKEETMTIRTKDGDVVTIPCDVDGVPTPLVRWFKKELSDSTSDLQITAHDELRFSPVTVSDIGEYTCQANNKFGSSEKNVFIDVFVPVSIEVPKRSTIETMVGQRLALPCRADGYPKPEIKWIYKEFDAKSPPKNLRFRSEEATYLGLHNMQLKDQGYYTCVASNIDGSSNITYEIIVNAAPIIENIYPDKIFGAVKGDLALRIQCKATGNPTPIIIWKKDDLNIAFGTEWYDIEDGTLIIKNIDEKSQGTYVCLAQNRIGNDTMLYDVIVNDYPKPGRVISRKDFEEGKSVTVPCDIPHKKTDLLRWYKDQKLIAMGELAFINVSREDEGLYSCRVSDHSKSRSAHVRVKVGYKPYFITDESEFIDFVEEDLVPLICEARGVPEPKVAWKFNGEKMSSTDTIYHLLMMFDNRGVYTCEVSNSLGSIQRSFNIVSKACIFDTTKDFFGNNQPLMLSPSLTWPTFNVFDNYMIVDHRQLFYLHCPKGFAKFPLYYVRAFCEGDTKIKIEGNIFNYADIKCNEEVEPVVKNGPKCLPGNTEYIQVGYQVLNGFLKVYEVCLDKENYIPLYTQHQLSAVQYGVTKNDSNWFEHSLLPLDFDTIYDCKLQTNDISTTLRRNFHLYDNCCFGKKQLVNPKDLRPGIPTVAAFSYLNVVPHWSTCNTKNWEDVEERVRNFAKFFESDLTIVTGVIKSPKFSYMHTENVSLHDNHGREQPVPQYLWKVVQDPVTSSSLAIIQVNVPDITTTDAPSYVHCRDICNETEWMRGTNWQNVGDGYTYCCSILDFESAFGYHEQFSRGKSAILKYAPLSPEYYYSVII